MRSNSGLDVVDDIIRDRLATAMHSSSFNYKTSMFLCSGEAKQPRAI
jgi:hypothetical protein